MGHSLARRRPLAHLAPALGRPDAPRRRGRAEIRLRRPDGHPLADADPFAERPRLWPGRPGTRAGTHQPLDFEDLVGPINGQYAALDAKGLAGTTDEAVYKDVRDRVFGYHLLVPDGVYTVTLNSARANSTGKGARVFDVMIQGQEGRRQAWISSSGPDGSRPSTSFSRTSPSTAGGWRSISATGSIIRRSPGSSSRARRTPARTYRQENQLRRTESRWITTPIGRRRRGLADCRDFYRDWARNQFGRAAAGEIAEIFARIDGKLPIPVNWTNGPGGIVPTSGPGTTWRKDFGFVDDLAALRPRLTGHGYLERFDYWLKNFEYMREIARFQCLWAEYNQALDKVKADDEARTAKAARPGSFRPGSKWSIR